MLLHACSRECSFRPAANPCACKAKWKGRAAGLETQVRDVAAWPAGCPEKEEVVTSEGGCQQARGQPEGGPCCPFQHSWGQLRSPSHCG